VDLFICSTALQAKIAQRIIHEKKIKDYEVFYFTHAESDKEKNYFHRLAEKSISSTFYLCRTRFPRYFFEIRRLFKTKKYNSIYLASVDNIYAHLVLTYCSFSMLKTFDDGASNISKGSMYYISRRLMVTDVIYFILGCRYTLQKVKSLSEEHFTIYPNRENIIENVSPISLFGADSLSRKDGVLVGECHVFLGCLWNVVTKSIDNSLSEKLENYFNDLDNCFYIPHPKDTSSYLSSLDRLSGELTAEDLVIELGRQFKTVNVYGIGSAALFNLLGIDWVNIFTLVDSELAEVFDRLSHSLIESGAKAFYIE
jgi:hypothetical protein